MENVAFNIPNQELNQTLSDISSDSKNQSTTPSDDELINDEELMAISGGFDLNFIGDAVKATGDLFSKIYNAGENMGHTASDYNHRNDSCR